MIPKFKGTEKLNTPCFWRPVDQWLVDKLNKQNQPSGFQLISDELETYWDVHGISKMDYNPFLTRLQIR